jgi:activator of HSP90 ATPase
MAKPLKVWNGSAWVDVAINLPSNYATATDLNNHVADTTSVHGIADTSVLATNSSVSSAISAHESDTTNVHGITNTANLATNSSVSATMDNEELLIIAGAL